MFPDSPAHNPNTHNPMAGTDSDLHLSPTADPPASLQLMLPPASPVVRNYYAVEYGRFFSYSNAAKSNVEHPILNRSDKIRPNSGAWISSSSASLELFVCDASDSQTPPELLLVISVRHRILEEHYVSKLHFTWPQMSCVSQSHMRGSRVVFASYRNSLGQVEKFAIRFANTSESLSFIDLLKESLKNVREMGTACSSLQSEYQPMIEFFTSDEMNHSDLSIVPSINYGMEHASSEQATHPDDYSDPYSTLPPSFTNLLANSCSETPEPAASNSMDLMSQITKYMTTSSFQDMLSMVEKVINDMGGDSALGI